MFFAEKITASYLTICDTHVDSSEEWHSCYQSNCFIKQTSALCTIRRVCSQDKIEKNYIMYYSPLFLFKMLGCLIYCCPGRQVCWIHVQTLEMHILHNTLRKCFHSTMPSSSCTNQKCKSVGCNPLRQLSQSSGLRYIQTAFLEHAKPIRSRHFSCTLNGLFQDAVIKILYQNVNWTKANSCMPACLSLS